MRQLFHSPKLATTGIVMLLLAACGGIASAPSAAPSTAPSKPAAAPVSSKPAAASVASKPSAAAAASKPAASASAAGASAAGASASAQMAPASAAALLPKPEVTKIRLGNNAHEADSFATEYANQLGIYKAYGFQSVTSTYFDGDAKGRQAMLADQIDIMSGSPASAIESLTTDTPILQIGMFITKPTDDLVTVGSVKTVADLKGKKIGVSTFGGDSHASVLLALKALGLKQTDATIVQIGGDSKRQAALKAGSIEAAPVDSSQEAQMKQLGFNVLVHLQDAPTNLARESIMVRKDFAQKNPNAVLDLVAANMAALQDEYADPNQAAAGYFKWIGTGTLPDAQNQIKLYLKLGLRDMRAPADGWTNLQEVMSTADAKLAKVDVKNAYTFQYLDKLKSLGFQKAIGVPGA